MRNFFVSIFMLALSTSCYSQVNYGIQFGALSTSASYQDEFSSQSGKVETNSSVVGFKIGGIASIPIYKNVTFMPELNYISKGVNNLSKSTNSSSTDSKKFRLNYIEIPLNIAYSSTSFFGGLGPVISIGINGMGTFEQFVGTVNPPMNRSIIFDGLNNGFNFPVHLKRYEISGNFFLGYKFTPSIFVKALYNTSFTDIYPSTTGYNTKYKSRYFGLTIGYLFQRGAKANK